MNNKTQQHQDVLNEQFLLACENANVPLAKTAISNGALAEARNDAGETALHLAVKSGSGDMVRYLTYDLRINVDLRDAFGRTPLHWAAQQGNLPVAEVLLLAHAQVGAKDDMGVEPKIYAEMAGHRDLVKIFSLVRSNRK